MTDLVTRFMHAVPTEFGTVFVRYHHLSGKWSFRIPEITTCRSWSAPKYEDAKAALHVAAIFARTGVHPDLGVG
jgi:hypothetical protein